MAAAGGGEPTRAQAAYSLRHTSIGSRQAVVLLPRPSPRPLHNQSAPRDQVLRRIGAAEEAGIVVSCRLQAQMNASHYQFEVKEKGWVERSLLTTERFDGRGASPPRSAAPTPSCSTSAPS